MWNIFYALSHFVCYRYVDALYRHCSDVHERLIWVRIRKTRSPLGFRWKWRIKYTRARSTYGNISRVERTRYWLVHITMYKPLALATSLPSAPPVHFYDHNAIRENDKKKNGSFIFFFSYLGLPFVCYSIQYIIMYIYIYYTIVWVRHCDVRIE